MEHIGANNSNEDDFNERFAREADVQVGWRENFLKECGTLYSILVSFRHHFEYGRHLQDIELGDGTSFERIDSTMYALLNWQSPIIPNDKVRVRATTASASARRERRVYRLSP